MSYFYPLILISLVLAPLLWIRHRHNKGKTVHSQLIFQIFAFFAVGLAMAGLGIQNVFAADPAATTAAGNITDMAWGMIAAALSTGLSGIGGGIAVAAAASAALGAISENDKVFGKAVLFVGLAEGIALYGMIISFMILGKF